MRVITKIVVHHTATDREVLTWDDIRRIHTQERGWSDVGYHAGVVLDRGQWGLALGRKDSVPGAHAKGFNQNSLGIAFEGNFDVDHSALSDVALEVGAMRIAWWCKEYGLDPDKDILMHREVPGAKTVCPGRFFPFDRLTRKVIQEASLIV